MYVFVGVCVCMSVYFCVYVCVQLRVCVFMCMWTEGVRRSEVAMFTVNTINLSFCDFDSHCSGS